MAKQATAQGIAYQQLKPLEGGNLGAIVEEHIRYWSKFDADEKAKKEALAAQQREYERKLNKDKDDRFKDVMPLLDRGEAEGYLADQYVKVVEMNEDEVYKLSQEWKENGNQDSYLKLKRKKEQADSASKISSTLTTAVTKEFIGLDKNPNYNPYLDKEKLDRLNILTGSGWTFDKDFNVIMIDPEDPSNTVTQTANEALNYWRTAKFSGNPDFEGIGTSIAESIKLYDNNGNKIKRDSNVKDGVMGWRNALKDNNLVLDTAVVKYKDELGEVKDNTLNESQLNTLGKLLYNEYTDHKIQESARRAPSTGTGDDKDKKPKTNIGIVTGGTTGNRKQFYIKDNLYYEESIGDKTTRVSLHSITKDNNNLILTAKETELIPKYTEYEDGTKEFTGWTKGRTKTIEVTDPAMKNKLANLIEVDGVKPETLDELPALLDKVKVDSKTTTTKTGVLD